MAKKKGTPVQKSEASGKPREATEPTTEPISEPQGEPETSAPREAKSKAESPTSESTDGPPRPSEDRPEAAAWALPIARLERGFTWFETRLLILVILGLVAALVAWVSVRAMSSPLTAEDPAGTVFRCFFGATILGFGASFVARKLGQGERGRAIAGALGILVGGAAGPAWRSVGIEYFGHIQNWMQEGSSLTMFGGLRGVSTRLTVLLAFIGGSLAAASGKHINIDIALRLVPKGLKRPVYVIQNVATVAFCALAGLAFFQYIAVTNFNARPEMSSGEMASVVSRSVSQDLFLFRKQLGLDVSNGYRVLVEKQKWDAEGAMTGAEWNTFLEESGYRETFTREEVDALRATDEALALPRIPLAIGPEGQPRNLLTRTMNLTFAVGFFFMAFRFVLRMVLVLTGHIGDDDGPAPDAESEAPSNADSSKAVA